MSGPQYLVSACGKWRMGRVLGRNFLRGGASSANFAAMIGYRAILGGILAIVIGTTAWADWPIGDPQTDTRPLSRSDAVD
ncbi:MAG: hypothetical protein KJP02_06760, partial [Octadecabacter sp.]|nr:hypothetical protein [Octadecabacter sp.]